MASLITAFTYKNKLPIDTTTSSLNVSANQTNYPLKIEIKSGLTGWTSGSLGHFFDGTYNPGGKRVQFFDDDGTTNLDYEVEYYDVSSQTAVYWVEKPTVTGNDDGTGSVNFIWAAYGNDPNSADQNSSTGGTWDNNNKLVHHYPDGTTLSMLDSTSNNNDGAGNGGVTAGSGLIDGAAYFDGVNDYVGVTTDTSLNITSNWTISGWFKSADTSSKQVGIIIRDDMTNRDWVVLIQTSGYIYAHHYVGGVAKAYAFSTLGVVDDNVYHYFSLKNDGTNLVMQVDTSSETATGKGGSTDTDSTDILIGTWRSIWGECFNGEIDEIRISNTTRSTNWSNLNYRTQKDNTWVSWGGEQSTGGGGTTQLFAAAIAGAATVAGILKGTWSLKSTINGVAGVTASMPVTYPLSCLIAGQATAAGDIKILRKLMASVNGSSSVSADLKNLLSLQAAINGGSTVEAILSNQGFLTLAAIIHGSSDVQAAMDVLLVLQAIINGNAIVTANLALIGQFLRQIDFSTPIKKQIDFSTPIKKQIDFSTPIE